MINENFLMEQGYFLPRQLPDGRWIALQSMFATTGLFVGLDETGYRFRYCYEMAGEAIYDVLHWDGIDHPPGNWIKLKGHGYDLLNPKWLGEAKEEING